MTERILHKTSDGSIIKFDKGKFDDWCVYVNENNKSYYAPLDIQYFTRLQSIGNIHGHKKLYDDFVEIYKETDKAINSDVIDKIMKLSNEYGDESDEVEKWFTVIYAGMVAEENKAFAILGKRIKRLGVYQILIDKEKPGIAARFSRGKKWYDLDEIMKKKGF